MIPGARSDSRSGSHTKGVGTIIVYELSRDKTGGLVHIGIPSGIGCSLAHLRYQHTIIAKICDFKPTAKREDICALKVKVRFVRKRNIVTGAIEITRRSPGEGHRAAGNGQRVLEGRWIDGHHSGAVCGPPDRDSGEAVREVRDLKRI